MTARTQPLPPPPADCNWKVLTTPDGDSFYLTWPLGKTLAEAGAPLLVGLMEMNERALAREGGQGNGDQEGSCPEEGMPAVRGADGDPA